MTERPILFNTEMVRAILDGRKTQTRRIIKLAPGFGGHPVGESGNPDNPLGFMYPCGIKRPPCNKGDILWVRETWSTHYDGYHPDLVYCYKADGLDLKAECLPGENNRWYPSIHMPKEAARIFLRVKDVRAEKLQDITVLDAINEGCCGTICDHADANPALGCTDCYNTGWLERPETEFALLWDTTVKKADLPVYGWDANPWVWVIEFERCEPTMEKHGAAGPAGRTMRKGGRRHG